MLRRSIGTTQGTTFSIAGMSGPLYTSGRGRSNDWNVEHRTSPCESRAVVERHLAIDLPDARTPVRLAAQPAEERIRQAFMSVSELAIWFSFGVDATVRSTVGMLGQRGIIPVERGIPLEAPCESHHATSRRPPTSPRRSKPELTAHHEGSFDTSAASRETVGATSW
jgi:hypothetical protein